MQNLMFLGLQHTLSTESQDIFASAASVLTVNEMVICLSWVLQLYESGVSLKKKKNL